MRRILSIIICCSLIFSGCNSVSPPKVNDLSLKVVTAAMNQQNIRKRFNDEESQDEQFNAKAINEVLSNEHDFGFTGLDDQTLVQYIQDDIYANLEYRFMSDDYQIDNISTVYISKEYLEELDYNSRTNLYFGYSLKELEEQFNGSKYVFTLSESGDTVVRRFEPYVDDTFDQVMKDVAIGTGLILVCLTISYVTAKMGISTISYIFATSAKKGAQYSAVGTVIGAAASSLIEGIETQNFESIQKSALKGAAKGLKIGAIVGITEGAKKAKYDVTRPIPNPHDAENQVLKKYPGKTQVPYKNRKVVPRNTKGTSIPDIIMDNHDGTFTAIEVKDYNLENNFSGLKQVLKKQISDRNNNLPKNFDQLIVLNVTGRNYSKEFVQNKIDDLLRELVNISPNVSIEAFGMLGAA